MEKDMAKAYLDFMNALWLLDMKAKELKEKLGAENGAEKVIHIESGSNLV